MKKFVSSIIILLACCASMVSCGDKKTLLFNGKNLDGWSFVLAPDSEVPASEVFGVKDGVITITGQPFGYMYTDKSYGDYQLHVEWRWVEEAANSGLFLNTRPGSELWPYCAEVNFQAGRAGDMISSGGSAFEELKESGGRFKPSPVQGSAENPAGEWNFADVVNDGGHITATINGVLKNEATMIDCTEGRIALQSEGGPLEIRNLYIIPLKKK